MESFGLTYLYALATVSITFVGFSALLLIFRQARGDVMTKYESYFMLSFMQPGFIVTAGSLVPSVLVLYGLPTITVWRVSSIIIAIPILLFVATLPGRRRAATSSPMPWFVRFFAFLQLLIALYLLTNAFPGSTTAGIAPYAAAITGLLFTTAIAYVMALRIALEQPPNTSR
jgi:hypothetical protein